ncbi:MAG: hypothetical protein JSW15_06870, partial [Deltaproteobacteria bacterium]
MGDPLAPDPKGPENREGGALKLWKGGGKDGRGPLGCGLEKRPPCPRGTGQKGMPRSSERALLKMHSERIPR